MKPAETRLVNFMRSAPFAMLACGVAALMLLSATTILPPDGFSSALIVNAPSMLAPNVPVAMGISAIVILAVIGIMLLTNRMFGIVRSTSKLFVALFAIMVCSIPMAPGLSMNPMVMCVIMMLCLMIMNTVYMRTGATRRIFLVFTLLSAGGCLVYGYLFFLPAMLLVAAQMRCFTVRSLLASLIGIATPIWILLGFGIITPDDFALPDVLWISRDTLSLITPPQLLALAMLVVISTCAVIFNVVRVYGYNARARAFNGINATLTLWTVLLVIFDFGNSMDYMPLLAALSATQLSLYFDLDKGRRPYIVILSVIAAFLFVFIWNIVPL